MTDEKPPTRSATKIPYPAPTSEVVSRVMRGNRKINTRPEKLLRSALHAAGFRFRVGLPVLAENLRVCPDIVFTRAKVAVFVDGCFWHSCPAHGTTPRSNTAYWQDKLRRNQIRDRLVTERLEEAGWRVVRVWEHAPTDEGVEQVSAALTSTTRAWAAQATCPGTTPEG